MNRAVVVALFIAALPVLAFAQREPTGHARGVVVDSGGRAIESVEISALTVGRFAPTDFGGRFSITGLTAGRNHLLERDATH